MWSAYGVLMPAGGSKEARGGVLIVQIKSKMKDMR
jgi:hypothetical protein